MVLWGTRVRRVRSGLGRKREPIWIGVRVGIAVIAGPFNCGHWSPEPVVVLSLEQGNRGIGKADAQDRNALRIHLNRGNLFLFIHNNASRLGIGSAEMMFSDSDPTSLSRFWHTSSSRRT